MVDLPSHLLHRTAVLLRLATARAEGMGEAALRDEGVTGREYGILELLAQGPPLTQIEMGRALHIDRTTCADLLAGLETRGLVARVAHPTNRRANQVSLTAAGEARRVRASAVLAECDDRFQAGLSAEQQAGLRQLLRVLVDAGAPDAG